MRQAPEHNAVLYATPVYYGIYVPASVRAVCPCTWKGVERILSRGDFGRQEIFFSMTEADDHRREHEAEPGPAWSVEDVDRLRDVMLGGGDVRSMRSFDPNDIPTRAERRKRWWRRL